MEVITLLKPRFWSFKNVGFLKKVNAGFFLFAGIGLIFWGGIFAVSYRILIYFQQVEDIGDILAYKLLSMVLLTFFSLLIFSSILTLLSKLYLSKDLALVHSMPVCREKIFLARWIESSLDSSWMVIVYAVPVFVAYGIVYDAGLFFYADMVLVLALLCIIASALSSLVILPAVFVLPASRIRSIFVFLGLAVLIILYITFRLLRPERLVNPESFSSLLVYLQDLGAPASPLLPSTWAFDSLKAALSGDIKSALFHVALSLSCAAFLIFVNLLVANAVYFKGFSKTQTSISRLFQSRSKGLDRLFSFLSGPARAFVVKEIKTFWRDQTQWSQIFLIAALIIIYVYNFSVLPLDKSPIKTVYLQNLFSFLNMALAAFVLTAVTARFSFPSVSMEGSSFWIVRSSPISIRAFLWIKFFIYLFPFLLLSEILIVVTNLLLDVSPFMMHLSAITIFFLTPGVVAMGIGLGAAYPDFASENPAQSVTSFGGLVFMIMSAIYIGVVTILEAGPVYMIFMAGLRGYNLSCFQWIWVIGSFSTAFALSMLAIILPMRFGEKRLSFKTKAIFF
ncbi:MAG: hypothetical protein LWW98_07885 [Deltaproteobacteria bacterium]|nr:hypothetical protein [Deltaproteobacteria bacterium]